MWRSKPRLKRITLTEEQIYLLEDDNTVSSAVLARLSHSNRDLWDKRDDL